MPFFMSFPKGICFCSSVDTEKQPPQTQADPAGFHPSGAVMIASEPVSRILSCAVIPLGAASPRTLISNLPGGFGKYSSRLSRTGPIRRAAWL